MMAAMGSHQGFLSIGFTSHVLLSLVGYKKQLGGIFILHQALHVLNTNITLIQKTSLDLTTTVNQCEMKMV